MGHRILIKSYSLKRPECRFKILRVCKVADGPFRIIKEGIET